MFSKLFPANKNGAPHQVSSTKAEKYLNYIAARNHPILVPERESHIFLKSIFDSPMFNPSVIAVEHNKIQCISRSSDIRHFRKWHPNFVRIPPDISNAWFTLDRNLNVLDVVPVDDSLLRTSCPEASFGIEDVRLFYHRGEIWGLGTGMAARSELKSKSCALLVRFDGARIVDFLALESPVGSFTEKNWIPIVLKDELKFIYSFKPLVVMKPQDGRAVTEIGRASADLPHFIRGGTGFIPWGDNYLAVIHFPPVGHPDIGKEKKYGIHAFIVIDCKFEILEISDPFFIHRRGIEFAAGLVDMGEHLLLSYGLGDRIAALAKIEKSLVQHYVLTSDVPSSNRRAIEQIRVIQKQEK